MPALRSLNPWLAAALSLSSIATGLALAGDCDAPDWQSIVWFFGLPLAAALFAGTAIDNALRRRFPAVAIALAVVLGLSIGVASWFASLGRFVGSCTN